MIKIRLNESQINKLFEYHAQRRLPFKDEFGDIDSEFGIKNAMENYLDWIEEFGKVGELPKSSIDFVQGINSGFGKAFEWFCDKYAVYYPGTSNLDVYDTKRKMYDKLGGYGFWKVGDQKTECKFNENGNMYVERVITLDYNIGDSVNDDNLYHNLIKNYQDNVGGCWCWYQGKAMAYCGYSMGCNILLRGYIRLDDIDWVETVYINAYNMNSECEIRVKPNAKVELFDIRATYGPKQDFYYDDIKGDYGAYDDYGGDFETYKFNLGGRHIIVNSTYFNNNGKYDDNGFAKVYDANSSEQMYRDREGNIMNISGVNAKKEELLMRKINSLQSDNSDKGYSEIFHSVMEVPRSSLCIIRDSGRVFLLDDSKNDELVCGMLFDNISFERKVFQSV